MYARLPAIALAAVGAGAFMIPPDMPLHADGDFRIAIPSSSKAPLQTMGVDPFTQIVTVPCPGCPFAQFGENGISWVSDKENYLVLNISVGANPKTLELNGVQFYPPAMPFFSSRPVPEVLQVPADVSLDELQSYRTRLAETARSLRVSSWSLVARTAHKSGETGERVLDLKLSLRGLEQQPISINDVTITAIKDKHSELLLLSSTVSKETTTIEKECQAWPLLCKWRATIADRVQAMKHKMKGGCQKRPGLPGMQFHGKKPHRPHYKTHHHHHHGERPQHHTHPGHHHHHRTKMHRFVDRLAQVMLSVVIPVLLGVLAGMITYLIGMVVGTGIALAWIRFRRWQRGEYTRIALDDSDEEPRESLEKDEFIVEEYVEAPPIYVEVEAREVGQK